MSRSSGEWVVISGLGIFLFFVIYSLLTKISQSEAVVLIIALGMGLLLAVRLHFVTIKRMSTEQEKLKAEHENLNDKLNQVCEEARALLRMEWLQSLHDINYGSELEVEIKFLTQLLMHLGYDIKNVSIRIPVNIKAGRQVISAQADWLINISTIVARKKFMVIEAKAPDQDLNSDVGEQARSYAFALNAPLYMLTNARRIMIFKLGVPQDFLLIDVPVSELTESWSTLTALLKQLGD